MFLKGEFRMTMQMMAPLAHIFGLISDGIDNWHDVPFNLISLIKDG
jgi:hypothetical protein